MKLLHVAFSAFATLPLLASERPMRATPEAPPPARTTNNATNGQPARSSQSLRQHVDECAVHSTSCNSVAIGRLEIGDCTVSDGTYVDTLEFFGSAGDVVTATLYPLDSTFTEPVGILVPPRTDASKTPFVIGGPGVSIAYQLSSTGAWRFGIGTHDLFSSGRYAFSLQCERGSLGSEQSCVDQNIICGQDFLWSLTSQSCTFTSVPDHLYAAHLIYGRAGDVLSIEVASNDFEPNVGVYSIGGRLLSIPASGPAGRASVVFLVPVDADYVIIATSEVARKAGTYLLTVNCRNSGCLPPTILDQPKSTTVGYGKSASLSISTIGYGPTQYTWFDSRGLPTLLATTKEPRFTTGPITEKQAYSVVVSNPCGEARSNVIFLTPEVPRRRAVRR